MIKITNLWKSYRVGDRKIEVLKGINLEFEKGDFVTITGPSGSGKTTLLSLIAGIDLPDEGNIEINGIIINKMNVSERALWRRSNIGYIPQFFFLIPYLTALENVELMARLAKVKESRKQAMKALEKVGLEDKMFKFPSELSGGEIQRVAIARAIVHNPPLIIADEPTAFLDSENKKKIVDILEDIWKEGRTVILATHDFFLARHKIVEIWDGKIKNK
ncbi:MAG: ABC transporter ATP-binding protein [Thermoproteota archaeon]|jgi:putative ABC transport system ATP-binding protein|nr:ABC transporter ATP-binding protein [Thermoproteota archaeon]